MCYASVNKYYLVIFYSRSVPMFSICYLAVTSFLIRRSIALHMFTICSLSVTTFLAQRTYVFHLPFVRVFILDESFPGGAVPMFSICSLSVTSFLVQRRLPMFSVVHRRYLYVPSATCVTSF